MAVAVALAVLETPGSHCTAEKELHAGRRTTSEQFPKPHEGYPVVLGPEKCDHLVAQTCVRQRRWWVVVRCRVVFEGDLRGRTGEDSRKTLRFCLQPCRGLYCSPRQERLAGSRWEVGKELGPHLQERPRVHSVAVVGRQAVETTSRESWAWVLTVRALGDLHGGRERQRLEPSTGHSDIRDTEQRGRCGGAAWKARRDQARGASWENRKGTGLGNPEAAEFPWLERVGPDWERLMGLLSAASAAPGVLPRES